jgi:hypothetical protein
LTETVAEPDERGDDIDMQKGTLPTPVATPEGGGLRPGHLLLVGVLAASAAAIVATRGTGAVNMVFVVMAVAAAGLTSAGVYRTLKPLIASDADEQADMVAGRTRAALEREKMLVLRSIKELEFDRAMRKISDADFQEMVSRQRSRAAGLIRQLDGASGYGELIERDLAALRGGAVPDGVKPQGPTAPLTCPSCQAPRDADARFCKACGARIGGRT